jgi:hypothetical protein
MDALPLTGQAISREYASLEELAEARQMTRNGRLGDDTAEEYAAARGSPAMWRRCYSGRHADARGCRLYRHDHSPLVGSCYRGLKKVERVPGKRT